MLTDNVLELIGNTPLVRLRGENIYAKAEFLNPGGSIKDRVALAMLEGAERDGRLHPDSIIVEPTSGNTGIGVALIGRLKGYQVRIVMPEGMSEERKKIIRALGAELILTPDEESIGGAVARVAPDGGRRPASLRPPAVREPRQSPLPLRDHRPRTVAANGRRDRLLRGRRGQRRHAARRRHVSQGAQAGRADRRRRAEERLRPAGPRAGAAPDSGHRRRLHPRRARHLAGR